MKQTQTIEQIFPDPKGRRAADALIDLLPLTTSLRDAMQMWEQTYFNRTGSSPFRKNGRFEP